MQYVATSRLGSDYKAGLEGTNAEWGWVVDGCTTLFDVAALEILSSR